MSSMFGGGFKASKCKTLLRLAMARIKLLRNKRDIQIKQMRRDIAQLLSSGQEPSARIRVEHIAREQNIMAAYDIIELFCELVIVRLPIIESQKVCPMDLKEAVCSLIFASPRCADLPELLQIRGLFSSKYGKEFAAAAAELRPDCGVNRRIIEKLSVRAPSGEMKLKLLTEIATEHNVSWDPADSEAELLKQPEDLLDGPKKFFGASQAPSPDHQPSPPKPDVPVSYPQRTSTVPPQAPAAAPSVTRAPIDPVLSSESEEEDSSREKKQFIPFVGPLPPKGVPAAKGSHSSAKGSSSGRYESSVSSSKEDPYARARKEGHLDNQKHGDYIDVAAAAKAAAQNADRAVAAARAAAELARTPSKRESLSRRASNDTEPSSSEEDSEDDEHIVETKSSSRYKPEPVQQNVNVGVAKANDTEYRQEKPDEFYRSNSDDIQEGSFRRSSSGDTQGGAFKKSHQEEQVDSFSRWNYQEEQPEENLNPTKKYDSGQESFWRSGDQDWRQAANLRPEKNIQSGGLFSSHDDEQESLYRRDSDIFRGSESDDRFGRRPKDSESYTSTSKIFSSSDSANNLFNTSNSDELDLRSSDETPFYDSKQGFATPKFDEEELPYSKHGNFTADSSFKDFDNQKSNFDGPKSKPSLSDFWRSSSLSHREEEEGMSRNYSSLGSAEKQRSGSYNMDDTPLDDSQRLYRGGSEPLSSGSYSKGEAAEYHKYENEGGSSPIPTKSRRTRNTTKSRENLEGAGGSGGLPPPPGRRSKFSSSENIESARSPDYHSPGEMDNQSIHSFDESPNFPPKTSLRFYNPLPERAPHSDTVRDSSPSLGAGSQSSRSSPVLDRKDSPTAPPLHPKLPDIDDLTARFEALKGKTKR